RGGPGALGELVPAGRQVGGRPLGGLGVTRARGRTNEETRDGFRRDYWSRRTATTRPARPTFLTTHYLEEAERRGRPDRGDGRRAHRGRGHSSDRFVDGSGASRLAQ